MDISENTSLIPQKKFDGEIYFQDKIAHNLIANELKAMITELIKPKIQPVLIMCIGTDRATGDSLGPLVGSKLTELALPRSLTIWGTIDDPIHAVNFLDYLDRLPKGTSKPLILAIDASLGSPDKVGCIIIREGPLVPGAGVNKTLPKVGDIHITGIVNVKGFMEYAVLQNTRLKLVMKMATVLAKGISLALADSL